MGAALGVTEFVALEGLIRKSPGMLRLLRFRPEELPLSAQIFGDEPDRAGLAARVVEELGFSLLDLNMGCPHRKICRHGSGSALLRDFKRAVAMVREAVRAVSIPVTVKIRLGFGREDRAAEALAPALEEAGARMLVVHGRTAEQGFSGKADWEAIGRVRETVKIPVVGNGDVLGAASALELFRQSNCDGIMIGRAALGNPWIFRDILQGDLRAEELSPWQRPDFREVFDLHLAWMEECYGSGRAAILFRKHAIRYLKGIPGAARLKEAVCHAQDTAEIRKILTESGRE
jgi:nifR3 family TIM-barrel protein